MTRTPTPPSHQRHAGRNLAFALGAFVLFFGVASLVKPPPRSASASGGGLPRPSGSALAQLSDHAEPGRLLGTLEGREYAVRCYASPLGPRYSVLTLDGRLLGSDLPADEVYRVFPGVDLESMRLEPGAGPLMLMDRD